MFGGKYHAFIVDNVNPKTPYSNVGYAAAKRLYNSYPCLTFVDRNDRVEYIETSKPPGNNGACLCVCCAVVLVGPVLC